MKYAFKMISVVMALGILILSIPVEAKSTVKLDCFNTDYTRICNASDRKIAKLIVPKEFSVIFGSKLRQVRLISQEKEKQFHFNFKFPFKNIRLRTS